MDRRLTFGTVAELYDRARPSYPPAVVDAVIGYAHARAGDAALEVGAGTGKATVLFAQRGLSVHALEPSREMALVARRNCADYPGVTVDEREFEAMVPARRYRLLFSAQAWHWVAPEARYALAARALEPGGALAVFWNRPDWSRTELREELDRAYATAVPDFGPAPGPMRPGDAAWFTDVHEEVATATGFRDREFRSFHWPCTYSTEEYVVLLQTHSDHIVLDRGRLDALLGEVARAIDGNRGSITVTYRTDLFLARRVP